MYNSPQQWKINTWQAHSPLSWASCFYFSCCHFFLLLLLFEYALLQDCRKQSSLPKMLQKAQHAGKYVTLTQSLTHTSEHSTQAIKTPAFIFSLRGFEQRTFHIEETIQPNLLPNTKGVKHNLSVLVGNLWHSPSPLRKLGAGAGWHVDAAT